MRKTNDCPSLGLLFTTTAALVSPVHETIARKPLYGSIAQLRVRSSIGSLIRKSMALLDLWRERIAQRKRLGLLNDHMLKDVGLDRKDVADELSKPFWRP